QSPAPRRAFCLRETTSDRGFDPVPAATLEIAPHPGTSPIQSPAVAARGACIDPIAWPPQQQGLGNALQFEPAGVAELADAQDLGSCDASRGGSSPSARTTRLAEGLG